MYYSQRNQQTVTTFSIIDLSIFFKFIYLFTEVWDIFAPFSLYFITQLLLKYIKFQCSNVERIYNIYTCTSCLRSNERYLVTILRRIKWNIVITIIKSRNTSVLVEIII